MARGIVRNGGSGNDLFTGSDRDDLLSGGGGNDTLNGGAGNDVLDGGTGNDTLNGGSGNDRVSGGAGNDLLIYVAAENRRSADIYDGGAGIDKLRLALTRDEFLRSDVQSDLTRYVDFLAANTGPSGEANSRVFSFNAFDLAASRIERVEVKVGGMFATLGTRGDDIVSGTDNADFITLFSGNDAVNAFGGNDVVFGGAGDDNLGGGEGDDILYGGAGNDTLSDFSGNDRFFGGEGDDFVFLGPADSAFVDGGAGNDFISGVLNDALDVRGGGGNDIIWVGASGQLFVDGGDGNDSLHINGGQTGSPGVVKGGAGDDLIEVEPAFGYFIDAGSGNDTIIGGPVIATGKGSDTVVVPYFNGGSPVPIVTDFSAGRKGDMLNIEPLLDTYAIGWDGSSNPFGAAGFLRVIQSGKHALLQFDEDGAVNGRNFVTMEILQDTKARSLTAENFAPGYDPGGAAPAGKTIRGTASDDVLTGTIGNDKIYGLGGNDDIKGGRGHDVLDGGDGNDILEGGFGNDSLYGGSGIDTLTDNHGNNRFFGGAGIDNVQSNTVGTAYVDTGADNDFVTLLNATGVDVRTGTGDDTLTLLSVSGNGFIDTGSGNDNLWLNGSDFFNTFTVKGGDGDDVVRLDAASIFDAGAGNDDITPGHARAHTITTGAGIDTTHLSVILPDSVTFTDFTPGAGGDVLEMQQVLSSTSWNPATNPFSSGFLRVTQSGSDTLVETDFDGQTNGESWYTIARLQNVDATTLVADNFNPVFDPHAPPGGFIGTDGPDIIVDGPGDDMLLGLGGDDGLTGSAGNDVLDGGEGNDSLIDHEGNNEFIGGAGNDFIQSFKFDQTGSAVMDGGAGNDFIWVQGQAFADVKGGDDDDNVLIYNNIDSIVDTGEGNDFLRIGGTVASATAATGGGNDSIYVDDGPVVLDAGAGNDQITVFNTGAQQIVATGTERDLIIPVTFSANGLVVTDFTPGPNGDWVEYSNLVSTFVNWDGVSNLFATGHLRLSQVGADTHFEIDQTGAADGESFVSAIILQGVTKTDLTATNFVPSFDLTGLPDVTLIGSDGVDGLNGGPGNDTIFGMGGDDFLRGNAGNDYIEDNAGNSYIEGGDGDDTVVSIFSGSRVDAFLGEGNNSALIDFAASVQVTAGSGNDFVRVQFSDGVTVVAGEGDNTIQSIDNGSNWISTGGGTDTISVTGTGQVDAGGGTNLVALGGGNINYNGGDGFDFVQIFSASSPHSITTGASGDEIRPGTTDPNCALLWDFTAGAGGDYITLGGILSAVVTTSNVHEYLSLGSDGFGGTILSIDLDGTGAADAFYPMLTFLNTTGLDLVDMVANGNIGSA